jgi:hypothetical protein
LKNRFVAGLFPRAPQNNRSGRLSAALLGSAHHSIAGHYASADVGHVIKRANLNPGSPRHLHCFARREWLTAKALLWISSCAKVAQDWLSI